MRRVMLLTFLALALSTAALATQVSFNTGFPANQANVTFTAGFPSAFTVDVNCPSCTVVTPPQIGPQDISLTTSDLTCPSLAPTTCMFTAGSVTVKGNGFFFTDTFDPNTPGTITLGSDTAVISAELAVTNIATGGGSANIGFTFTGDDATAGNGSVIADGFVPEPGTLWLLGTGLISLGGTAIRKLRLGT